jgi:hypothetical protein
MKRIIRVKNLEAARLDYATIDFLFPSDDERLNARAPFMKRRQRVFVYRGTN